ncbi:MAG: bifunctional serine/threonine-protein kinase/ABC transporter substrate-binding protein [Thermoanaerobaculia bacterium]
MDDGSRKAEATPRSPLADESPGIRLFAPGSDVGTRFEIRSIRGVGGSAVVYSAFDRELRQAVALKVLRADRTSPAALVRMKREVAIARQAASPRLVRVFDIDTSVESVFLTMEDVPGGSLKERLAAGRLPLEETLRVAGEVLEGLAVLHGLGIVHRDVKPGNVLLDAEGSVKLADFGLARRLEIDETRATSIDAVVGTVEYLSPEQALGHDLDGRSDLYSFGVTLFEMLTGGLPFRRDSAISTALAHVRDAAPRLRSVRPDVPAWLDAFVARLLSKDPGERYATAEAALADLRARKAEGTPRNARRRALAIATFLSVAALAVAVVGRQLAKPSGAVRLAPHANARGVVALDADGRALWERADVPNFSAVRFYRRPGGERGVAAVVGEATGMEHTGARLLLLDPESGVVRKEILVASPDGAGSWSVPNRWGFGALDAVDTDGVDGDELVFSFANPESFPSVVVLVNPETGVSQPLLFGSGHQVFLGSVDLDRDGRKELLFASAANRLGQYAAVAAVRPAAFATLRDSIGVAGPLAAATPDLPVFEDRLPLLAWYALGPAWRSGVARRMEVDEERRVLRFTGLSLEPFELGFDGFPVGSPAEVGAEARQARRTSAWKLLLRAARLADGGHPAAAASVAAEAAATVAPAGDPSVLEWARRCEGRFRVAAGQAEDGERIFREISREAVARTSIAIDAARALHLGGELSRAVPWYREAVLGRGNREELWIVGDALTDGLLALCERRRFDDALALIDGAQADWTFKEETRALVLWRAGRPLPPRRWSEPSTSLRRTWLLEERLAEGTDAESLHADVAAERGRSSGDGELLDLLEAELLLRTGRGEEAWKLASPAFSALWGRRARDITARAHLELASDRAARAAAAVGRASEAQRIRSDVRRFLAAAR